MKIAGECIVKHLYNVDENDRVFLRRINYEYTGTDIYGNEIWEQIINYDREDLYERF